MYQHLNDTGKISMATAQGRQANVDPARASFNYPEKFEFFLSAPTALTPENLEISKKMVFGKVLFINLYIFSIK